MSEDGRFGGSHSLCQRCVEVYVVQRALNHKKSKLGKSFIMCRHLSVEADQLTRTETNPAQKQKVDKAQSRIQPEQNDFLGR